MQILKAGALYFGLVFVAGFMRAILRGLGIFPRVPTQTAELIGTTVMFVVTLLAAHWVVRWLGVPPAPFKRLAVGLVALGMDLVAQSTILFWVRGLTIREAIANQDPVTGASYYVMLVVLAVMPLLVARR
jgi:hypothetical protein